MDLGTGGNVDAPDVFAELVGDGAGDSQVQPRDHFDCVDGLAVLVGALVLWGRNIHQNQKKKNEKKNPSIYHERAEWHGAGASS